MSKSTYAISRCDDINEMRVQETPDGFGVFQTEVEAAERIIELCDARMKRLRASKKAAQRIIRRALKGKQHVK